MSPIDKGPQLPVDDWTDQDLLTKDEARDRLLDEIDGVKAKLDHLLTERSDSDAEVTLLRRRLEAMEAICGEYSAYLADQ